jgi:copper chaperone CopZ
MEKKTVQVPNIGCDGCVNTIQNELSELPGVRTVKGDVESKTVIVEWDKPANWETIAQSLTAIDYAPAEG